MEIRKVDSSANELLDGPQADKSELAAKSNGCISSFLC